LDVQGIPISGEQVEAICFLAKSQWKPLFDQMRLQETSLIATTSDAENLLGIHFRVKKINELESLFMGVIDKQKKK